MYPAMAELADAGACQMVACDQGLSGSLCQQWRAGSSPAGRTNDNGAQREELRIGHSFVSIFDSPASFAFPPSAWTSLGLTYSGLSSWSRLISASSGVSRPPGLVPSFSMRLWSLSSVWVAGPPSLSQSASVVA